MITFPGIPSIEMPCARATRFVDFRVTVDELLEGPN